MLRRMPSEHCTRSLVVTARTVIDTVSVEVADTFAVAAGTGQAATQALVTSPARWCSPGLKVHF